MTNKCLLIASPSFSINIDFKNDISTSLKYLNSLVVICRK